MESTANIMPSTPLLFNDAAKSPVAPLNYQESHNMPNGTATKQSTERSPPSIDGSSILNSKAGEISSVMNNTVNGDTNGITNSTINHMQDSPYKVLEQWHSKPTHLRLIHVGAGAGGLLVAYKMQKQFTNYELVCYEKNPHIGGTWFENRYPGCGCDVPAHAYTYSFEPNPNWSRFYAKAPEIRQYFEDFATKYKLKQFVKLNSRVIAAKWIEEKGIYEVKISSSGTIIDDWCNVLVNGSGFLNDWKWPKVDGLHDFAGRLMHTSNWDPTIEWQGKRIAVIGTGSTAIQVIPELQKEAKQLTCFMRSVTWISPPIAAGHLEKLQQVGAKPELLESDEPPTQTPTGNYFYTDAEKKRFRGDPEHHLQYRKKLDADFNASYDIFIAGSDASQRAEAGMKAEMIRRIGPGHEELKEKLIPSWPPGCRRLTPGDGYLEALVQPNVVRVHKEIAKVVLEGIVDADGTLHEFDILVCATGFNMAFAPRFDLRGMGNVSMAEEFDPEPYVYLGVAAPKFPNYFIVNGVRGNWTAGSTLPYHEVHIEYILKCVKRIQTERIKAMEVKREPINQLYEHIDEWHKRSVFSANCKSWYKNNTLGGKLWVWGGSALHFMKTVKEVKYEHYEFRYHDRNMWTYLGNGRIEPEVFHDMEHLTPYMRNADVPWTI